MKQLNTRTFTKTMVYCLKGSHSASIWMVSSLIIYTDRFLVKRRVPKRSTVSAIQRGRALDQGAPGTVSTLDHLARSIKIVAVAIEIQDSFFPAQVDTYVASSTGTHTIICDKDSVLSRGAFFKWMGDSQSSHYKYQELHIEWSSRLIKYPPWSHKCGWVPSVRTVKRGFSWALRFGYELFYLILSGQTILVLLDYYSSSREQFSRRASRPLPRKRFHYNLLSWVKIPD